MDEINITSAQYVATDGVNKSIKVVIDGVTMFVPLTTDNRHYAAILEWVDEGNTIQEAE